MVNLGNDHVTPFVTSSITSRGRIVRLGKEVEKVLKLHNYHPIISKQLLELSCIVGVFLPDLKCEDSVVSLQILGDGIVSSMIVDINQEGHIRGWASYDEEKLSKITSTASVTIESLFGVAKLLLTIDLHQRYQTIIQLKGTTLTQCIHSFFCHSQQIETFLSLFTADLDDKESGYSAGCLMLQKLPDPNLFAYENWITDLTLAKTITKSEILSLALTDEEILYRLFNQRDVQVFTKYNIIAKCRCSQEKAENIIKSFYPYEDIEDDEPLQIVCEFCNSTFSYTVNQ